MGTTLDGGARHPSGPPRPRRALLLLVAFVLLVGATAACSSGSESTTGVGTTLRVTDDVAEADTSPGPTTSPAPTDDALRALEAEVAELSRFVEAERGLEFLEPVTVHLAEDDEFESLLLDAVGEEDWAAIEDEAVLYEALGLLEPGTDLRAAFTDLLSGGVAGFYDPETDELVVRGGEITPMVRQVIVHELVHALDDQHFELHRPEYAERADETSFGFSSVLEGNARRIEGAWHDQLPEAERRAVEREELEAMSRQQERIERVPPVLIEELSAPYSYGEIFVREVLDAQGQAGLDALIVEPPTSSEQILHPSRFLATGERPLEVAPPTSEEGAEVINEGVLGEFRTSLVLVQETSQRRAREAASGWGGDRYVSWRRPDGTACAAVVWKMDSAADLNELRDVLALFVVPRPGAGLSGPSADSVQLDICAARPGQGDMASWPGAGSVAPGARAA